MSLDALEHETRTVTLSIKKVRAEDLKRNYVCHARNGKGEVEQPATVKQKGNGCMPSAEESRNSNVTFW